MHLASVAGLSLALVKELSGEAHIDRAMAQAVVSSEILASETSLLKADVHAGEGEQVQRNAAAQIYLDVTEKRFKGVRRCC